MWFRAFTSTHSASAWMKLLKPGFHSRRFSYPGTSFSSFNYTVSFRSTWCLCILSPLSFTPSFSYEHSLPSHSEPSISVHSFPFLHSYPPSQRIVPYPTNLPLLSIILTHFFTHLLILRFQRYNFPFILHHHSCHSSVEFQGRFHLPFRKRAPFLTTSQKVYHQVGYLGGFIAVFADIFPTFALI